MGHVPKTMQYMNHADSFLHFSMIKLMANEALNHEDDSSDTMLLIWWKSALLLCHFIPAMALNINFVHLWGVNNTIKE